MMNSHPDPSTREDFVVYFNGRLNPRLVACASWLLRVALATAFLSAVADRFGLWGPPGAAGVSWGNLEHYNAYVAQLNWFVPAVFIPLVGWTGTVAETALAISLLVGWRLRWAALLSATLLLVFALTMTVALGPKAPLSYSVFTASSAAFLLFAIQPAKDSQNVTKKGVRPPEMSAGIDE